MSDDGILDAYRDIVEKIRCVDDIEHSRWLLGLNEYQRANLLWLIRCIIGNDIVEPFNFANTGDWIYEISNLLDGHELGEQKPNVDENELKHRIKYWLDQKIADDTNVRLHDTVNSVLALARRLDAIAKSSDSQTKSLIDECSDELRLIALNARVFSLCVDCTGKGCEKCKMIGWIKR